MDDSKYFPALKPLHSEASLNPGKLKKFEQLTTEVILESLALDQEECLKTRPDGTILDGHHRIHVLRKRQFDVDSLPRDVVKRDQEQEDR